MRKKKIKVCLKGPIKHIFLPFLVLNMKICWCCQKTSFFTKKHRKIKFRLAKQIFGGVLKSKMQIFYLFNLNKTLIWNVGLVPNVFFSSYWLEKTGVKNHTYLILWEKCLALKSTLWHKAQFKESSQIDYKFSAYFLHFW